ncbi:MAG: hypothetical protein KHY19_02590 [Coprobacillus cateniformis]|nr:hypothetical protein [Coprobacillus cateniformis]
MEFKTREEAIQYILAHEIDTYPPLDYSSMSDEDVFEHAYEVYELIKLMNKNIRLKELSRN